MRGVKVGPIVCLVAALIALGLWPLSYDKVSVVMVSLGKFGIVATSYNGNLNLSLNPVRSAPKIDFSYSERIINLAERGSNSALQFRNQGELHKIRRPFGKPIFRIFDDSGFTRITFQLPHWIVAFIFPLIGSLWQIFGKRPDDAVESD